MSVELERAVLGALALQPSLIEGFPLCASDFSPGRLRETFAVISSIWEEERSSQIDPLLLAERLGGNGAAEFVGSLFNGSVRLDQPQLNRQARELRKCTLTRKIESVLLSQANARQLDLDEIRADLDEYDSLDEEAFDPSRILITGTEMQALDLKTEYAIEKLVPCRSITLIHGPGGLAKTWLALCITKAVSEGKPFLGLQTKQRLVTYIDYENPLPMLVERVRRLDIRDARFWHLSASLRPPKLDSEDWTLFKALPSGLLVFDTARSSFDGDENSSRDVGLVMSRLKELRELDHEIIVLHHTPRANERQAKGSTAWEDLADHVLAFYKVRRETLEETDEEINFEEKALLSLGTGRKTRFVPFRIYLTLDPDNGGFVLSEGPDSATMNALADYIAGEGLGKNQSEIIEWAKGAGVGPRMKQSFRALLDRGEQQKRWTSHKGFKGSRIYEPIR